MPLFMIGFKDTDTGFDGEKLLKKAIETEILMKMIFGKSSRIYKKLYEQGLINASFDTDYTYQKDYAFATLEGESKDPKKVMETVMSELEIIRSEGLSKDDFERIKKVMWGRYIRSMNDVEDYATDFLRNVFLGIDYFNYDTVYRSVTFEDVCFRLDNLFVESKAALSVINPV